MDTFDLFRKLGSGAKFDFKKFGKDAERFKVLRSKKDGTSSSDILSGIDFFGSVKPSVPVGTSCSTSEVGPCGDTEVEDEERLHRRNKRKPDIESVLKKGRKKKSNKECNGAPDVVQQGEAESRSIRWMASLDTVGTSGKDENKSKTSLKRLKHLHQEKVNHLRHQNRINVHGADVPDPVDTFLALQDEYQLDPRLIHNLHTSGFQKPTPIQMQAIPLLLHRREVLACAPTGSGKTIAFCLPLLAHLRHPANRGIRALVISPTRELATQTHRELLKLSDGLGFRIHIIDSSAAAVKKYGPKSAKKFDILVTTPNRLIYLLNQEPPAVDLSSVEWLVVDESDKLFEEGKSGFREQLATIFLACSSPRIRRALFSATFALDVEQWCRLNLDNLVSVSIGQRNSAVTTVEQELLFVGTESGKLVAMREMIRKGFLPPVLVFVQSIDRARELFHELVYEGINVDVIHANRTQQQRDNVVSSFRSGKIWVLICTALLARGIDFKGVNLVVNYDFPTSAVEYIHRIGRTGRAGHTGRAVTFFTEDDKPLLRSIANVIKRAGCPVPDYMIGFKKIHSKAKRQLEKKPPRRATIRTTPGLLMSKRGAKRRRRNKQEVEAGPQEAAESTAE